MPTSEAMQTPGTRDAHGAPRRDRRLGLNAVGKATEDSPDDCRKSGCSVLFCRPNCLVSEARRWRKVSFGLNLLNREGANCRCETPESISNSFECSGPQLRLTCDRNQIVRCSCFHGMVIPYLAAIARVWDFLLSRAGWLSLPHSADAAKEPDWFRASSLNPNEKHDARRAPSSFL